MDEVLPARVDVCVIGGGLAGASCALALVRSAVDVLLVEARSVGSGGSGVGPGVVDLGPVELPHRTLAALGEAPTRALYGFTDRNRVLLEQEGLLDVCGVLWAAVHAQEAAAMDASAEALATLGRPAERLDADTTDLRTGGVGFLGGLRVPDGGVMRPGAVRALVERARADGCRVVEGVPAALGDGPGPVEVRLGDAVVRAEMVVIAAGVGSGAVDTRLRDAYLPVRDGAVAFEPSGRRLPGVGRAGQGWTAWREAPDRVVVSGARWATPHLEVGETVPALDPRVRARLEAFGERHLRVGPALEASAWLFAQTRDQLPLVGPMPGQSRRVVLLGFGPNPATWGMAAGRAAADGILGDGGEVPDVLASRRLVRWTR